MVFWPIYAVMALVYLLTRKSGGAVASTVAAVIGVICHSVGVYVLPLCGDQPYIGYAALWFIAFSWTLILDRLKLRHSYIVSGCLSLLLLVMVFWSDSDFMYRIYPLLIVVINAAMFYSIHRDRNEHIIDWIDSRGHGQGDIQSGGDVQ